MNNTFMGLELLASCSSSLLYYVNMSSFAIKINIHTLYYCESRKEGVKGGGGGRKMGISKKNFNLK